MQALTNPTRFFIFLFLLFGGLYFAKVVLVPLAIGGLLATLFLPLSTRLERRGVSRPLASFICVCCFVVAVGGIILLLAWQSADLTRDLAGIEQRVTTFIDQARQFVSQKFGIGAEQQKAYMQKQSSSAAQLPGIVLNVMDSLLGITVDLVLVLVYTFLFLFLRRRIKNFLLRLVPASQQGETHKVIDESSQITQRYLIGTFTMTGMLWVLYGIGFSIVGVKHAIFLAILCGLLELIPFVGNLSGSLFTILVSLAQGGDSQLILGIVIVYGIVQFTQTYLLEPLIVGSQVSVNPLFTILVIVIGEAVWGIPGMILALPALGVVKIICDHVEPLKPYGYLIGQEEQKKSLGLVDKLKAMFGTS
ncbi:AI-2E family transporter [Spirosoma fluminis]